MKCAGAYLFGRRIVLASERQTTAGVWISDAWAEAYDPDDTIALGKALLEALGRSTLETPHPTDWKAIKFPVPAVAGAKNLKVFMLTARHASAELQNGEVVLRPSRNLGPKQGFEPTGEALTIDADKTDQIGKALLRALAIE